MLCHRLVYTEAANARHFRQQGRWNVGRFHGPCYYAWHQSATMRAWVSDCRRAGVTGQLKPEMPIPPRPAKRMSSDEELAEGYAATVRYFWQREESSRAARDEHGELLSIAALARSMGLSRVSLYNRVQRFLSLLPDEGAAKGRVKAWRDVFLTLNAAETGTTENVIQGAQPQGLNVRQVAQP